MAESIRKQSDDDLDEINPLLDGDFQVQAPWEAVDCVNISNQHLIMQELSRHASKKVVTTLQVQNRQAGRCQGF